MDKEKISLSNDVTEFLDNLNHPLRNEIEKLRIVIMGAERNLLENVKWNGPNYSHEGRDRITMRIQPPRKVQLIFHRGAKKVVQPENRLIVDKTGLLQWKENDRAVVTFMSKEEVDKGSQSLSEIVRKWIEATAEMM